MLWIGALLATLLGLDRLFQDDREDGASTCWRLSGLPLELMVLANAPAHWLATGLPLVGRRPLLGLLLGARAAALGATTLTLLIGTPALTLIGAIGAALTAALRRGGLLVAVLVLPFTIPGADLRGQCGYGGGDRAEPFLPPFLILAALTLVSAVVAAVAGAAALRVGLD